MRRPVAWTLLAAALLLAPAWARAASPKADAVARGEKVYTDLCWTCHGRYGRGDGPARKDLAVPPPDFTDPKLLAGRSDEAILARLTEGGSQHVMMMGTVVAPQNMKDALAFIRTLAVPGQHVSLRAGRDIYNGSCWVCHGIHGNGKGPAAKNLVGAQPRDFTSPKFVIKGREAEIARTISEGAAKSIHGSAYMPAWGAHLSPQQIKDVIAYISTLKAAAHPAP